MESQLCPCCFAASLGEGPSEGLAACCPVWREGPACRARSTGLNRTNLFVGPWRMLSCRLIPSLAVAAGTQGLCSYLQNLPNVLRCAGGSLCVVVDRYVLRGDGCVYQNIGRPILWHRGLGFSESSLLVIRSANPRGCHFAPLVGLFFFFFCF